MQYTLIWKAVGTMLGIETNVLKQKERFDPWIEHGDMSSAANALMILCARVNSMITRYLENSL